MAIRARTAFGEKPIDYARFRPDYDLSIFDFLMENLRCESRKAVELGAGAGQATRRIAKLFDRVIAVEPDQRLIENADLPENVTAKVAAAEDADFGAGSVSAVVAATSFHWMDQTKICRNASNWLSTGGVFFPFAYDVFKLEGAAQRFFASEYEKWKPYRDRRLDENYDYCAALREAGVFHSVMPYQSQTVAELSIEEATGLISTFSYAAAYGRDNGGHEEYFKNVASKLSEYGPTIRMVFPIVGALGLVA